MPSDVPDVRSTRSAVTGDAAGGEIGGDGLAGVENARRRRVTVVAVAHGPDHRLDEVRRRLEAEGDRVADVEVAYSLTRGLDFTCLGDYVPDRVGEAAHARGDRNGGRNNSHGRRF